MYVIYVRSTTYNSGYYAGDHEHFIQTTVLISSGTRRYTTLEEATQVTRTLKSRYPESDCFVLEVEGSFELCNEFVCFLSGTSECPNYDGCYECEVYGDCHACSNKEALIHGKHVLCSLYLQNYNPLLSEKEV